MKSSQRLGACRTRMDGISLKRASVPGASCSISAAVLPSHPPNPTSCNRGSKAHRQAMPLGQRLCKRPAAQQGRRNDLRPGHHIAHGCAHLCPAFFRQRIVDLAAIFAPANGLTVAHQIQCRDSLQHHQVIAVDQLGFVHVAELGLDRAAGLAGNPARFAGTVIGQPARNLAPARHQPLPPPRRAQTRP